ncbi:hypothetical protein H1R20_g4055, partial [Candolleomyces eurysporus]
MQTSSGPSSGSDSTSNARGAARPRGEAGRSGDGNKPGFSTRDAMNEVTPISDDLWRELHRITREGLSKFDFDVSTTYRNQEPRKCSAIRAHIAVHFPNLFNRGLFLRNWPLHELAMLIFNNKRKDFKSRQSGRRKKRSKKSQGKQKARDELSDDESDPEVNPSLNGEESESNGTPSPGLIVPSSDNDNERVGGGDIDPEEEEFSGGKEGEVGGEEGTYGSHIHLYFTHQPILLKSCV